jgi:hypothetical protein
MRLLDFSIYLIFPAAILPSRWLSLKRELVPGIILLGKADNLIAICEPIV